MKLRNVALALVLILMATACGDRAAVAPLPTVEAWQPVSAQIMAGIPAPLPADQGPVYVMLREGGAARGETWHEGMLWSEALAPAIVAAYGEASAKSRAGIDCIEICLTHGYRDVDPNKDKRALTNVHRGVRGLELSAEWRTERYSPTWMLATNRDFKKLVDNFGVGLARARLFEAHQILLLRGEDGNWTVHPMFRGNTVVPMEDVTRENVEVLARSMATWLANQVHDDGRMTYKYWPSSGEESDSINTIRLFMATVCLGRLAEFYPDEGFRQLQDRNLAYNFEHMYRERDAIGYIDESGKAKLGAAALAALALVEHPSTHPYTRQQERLIGLTRYLYQDDGSFRTFYLPADQNDNQNFYPGEALVLWAELLERADDPALMQSFMTSVAYYRTWHIQNRNPAFVPWHTQAYYNLWRKTKDPGLADWVFEMNDWLLSMQEWDKAVYPDTPGRFYDVDRAHYGPPHASSTGVYLEGLIDAYALARDLGDAARAERYRVVICRGIRSLMQLQFADDIDMYYVSNRRPVEGGIRTTEYNNEIRVDNIQHGLMGLLKILTIFAEEDFSAGHLLVGVTPK